MIIVGIAFALILGVLIFLVLPHSPKVRGPISVGVFIALIASVYFGGIESMSRPKPFGLEWRQENKAQVLAAMPVEGEAIYILLALPGVNEPRLYVLPWSIETAQKLQDAMSEAESEGEPGNVEMRMEGGLDDREPLFYARPQPPPPPKDMTPAPAPLVVERN